MGRIPFLLLFALLLASCGRDARVGGHLVCKGGDETIFLELVSPRGVVAVDSVATSDGRFRFRVSLPGGQTSVYNIRCGANAIPVILSGGERVRINGVGNVARNYTVSGSAESELVGRLALTLNNGAAVLDSLAAIYTQSGQADSVRQALLKQYTDVYFAAKRSQIRFIAGHAGSMAALYALYQRLPNDASLSGDAQSDLIYYRMVADSVELKYPRSDYLAALRADIERMTPRDFAIDSSKVFVRNYPEVDMPDLYGKRVKLSSLEGGVVLLDFWAASSPKCRLMNAELRELWNDLHDAGFEVYQVGVDTNKPQWVNTVLEQHVPWITVCDFEGANSLPVRVYNVKEVPANFLIDRNGNIVDRNVYGDRLRARVKQLL